MILAWIGALAIGLSLGLLGSGGSILTVPVLVYLLGQGEKQAIAGSLFVVGTVAAVGGLRFAWRRTVDWRSVVWFGVPGMAGTWLGALLGGLVSGALQLTVFAGVMLLAAVLMVRQPGGRGVAGFGGDGDDGARPRHVVKVALDGLVVGVLTGFVGVGGGFLIVPALVLLGGLSMHLAVGTSLVIIALKSFTGFWKYLDVLAAAGLALDWPALLLVAGLGTTGSLAGAWMGGHMPQTLLRRLFAALLVVIGGLILWRSLPGVL